MAYQRLVQSMYAMEAISSQINSAWLVMKKWYTEFGAAIEKNHNVIQRSSELRNAEGAL